MLWPSPGLHRSQPTASADQALVIGTQVTKCELLRPHDWQACTCAHMGETARRRDPSLYKPVPCPDVKNVRKMPRGAATSTLLLHAASPVFLICSCACLRGPAIGTAPAYTGAMPDWDCLRAAAPAEAGVPARRDLPLHPFPLRVLAAP